MNQLDIFNESKQLKTPPKKMVPFFKNGGKTPPGQLCSCDNCGYYSRYCKCMVEEGNQWDVSTLEKINEIKKKFNM